MARKKHDEVTKAPNPDLEQDDGGEEEANAITEGWSVVNTTQADLTLHGGGQLVMIPGALLQGDGSIMERGEAVIPAAIVNALYDSTYFRSLFKNGTLRKV